MCLITRYNGDTHNACVLTPMNAPSTDPIIDVTHGIAKYPTNSIAIFPLLGSLKQRAGGFGDQRKPAHSGSPLPGCTMLLRTGLNRPTLTTEAKLQSANQSMERTRRVDSNRPPLRDANRIRVETMMRGRRYTLLHSPPEAQRYTRYHQLPHREMRQRRWLRDYLASVSEEMDRRRLQARAGIDDHRLESLHRPRLGETREEACAVCLQDFGEKDEELRMMPCSHSFHQRCIFGWLAIRDNCPVCRSAMSSYNDVLEELHAELEQWIQGTYGERLRRVLLPQIDGGGCLRGRKSTTKRFPSHRELELPRLPPNFWKQN
uniref:RING-type domain-containing protein n=1 Tax=Oryza rufipogon TaxID=4529 RepID=A0A0E0R435_ORYRU